MLRYKLLLFFIGVTVGLPVISAGAARRPRIVEGEKSNAGDFRYHVAILHVNLDDGSTRHVCGGAIIDRRYVLTAAHCVYNNNSAEVMVRHGGNVPPPPDKPHHERRVFRRVAKIMYPKDYIKDARFHEYDIAVLKIVGTFDIVDEENFKKVYLPYPDDDFEQKWATVSGYGVNDAQELETKLDGNNFRSLETLVIGNDECQESRTYILTRGSLCTQSIKMVGHTCHVAVRGEAEDGIHANMIFCYPAKGDGGDPLVFENQIIGVLNAPSTCDTKLPELFTRVSTYVDFIKKILDGRVSSDVVYR